MRTLKRMTVIHGIPETKCLIIKSHITDRNSGKIPPQTINTNQDLPTSATYLCKININGEVHTKTQLCDKCIIGKEMTNTSKRRYF